MKFICKRWVLFIAIALVFKQNCIAQSESLHFDQIGFEEGISNENVLAILQDRNGYIWFGTMDGLNKYDGYSFTKYKFDPFDSSSLSQNTIYTIWEDKYGFIWVGTYEGLCRFDRTTEKFSRFKPDPNAKFSDPNITSINEDRDGMMWVGSFTGGLCRFDRKKGIFLPDRFDIMYVTCISKDEAGTLWVGNSTGLHRVTLKEKKVGELAEVSFKSYLSDPTHPDSLSGNNVRCIFEDHQGIMWLATDNGLNSFDKRTGLFKHYQHDPKNIHSISSNNLANGFVNLIKEDHAGNLWIATDNGLNRLNQERTSFKSYFNNPNDAHSLSTNNVKSLYIDEADVLYAGSWGGKLNKANLNPKPFGLLRKDPNNVNSLSSNVVTSIIEDASGIIWIGTYGGGLNRWDKKTNQFRHFRHNINDTRTLRSDTIMALLEDKHGHLWVCNGDVLSQLNKQTGEFTHHYSNVKNHKDDHMRFIHSITKTARDFFGWQREMASSVSMKKTGSFGISSTIPPIQTVLVTTRP